MNNFKITKKPIYIMKKEHLKPIFKWSGGKSDEIKFFKHHFPEKFDTYLEPFLGGGGVYFYLNPEKSVVTDVHKELISLYEIVKEERMDEIYEWMENHNNDEETYYKVRSMDRDEKELTKFENACRFYYLRKTCYRGMLRYNRKGQFNVPFGKYKTFNFENLKDERYEKLLKNTKIYLEDFEYIFKNYDNENNFMFLDPPYDSTFTDYGYCSFGKEEHKKLAKLFKESKCKCLMIIGETDFIKELYKDYIVEKYDKKYKFRLHSNRINSDNIDKKHLIIKNY
jgi:DNA adenine methylase